MGNYIQEIQDKLEEKLKMRGTPYEGLLETYGLLVLTVGENCTQEHIHDAWSVWQNKTQPDHRSLKPFNELTKEVQELDEPYRVAVVEVTRETIASSPMKPEGSSVDEELVKIFVWVANMLVEKNAVPRSQFHQDLDSEAIRRIKQVVQAYLTAKLSELLEKIDDGKKSHSMAVIRAHFNSALKDLR